LESHVGIVILCPSLFQKQRADAVVFWLHENKSRYITIYLNRYVVIDDGLVPETIFKEVDLVESLFFAVYLGKEVLNKVGKYA